MVDLIFMHNGDERSALLRGGPAYQVIDARADLDYRLIHYGSGGSKMRLRRATVIRVMNPGSHAVVQSLEQCKASQMIVIVDVCFPPDTASSVYSGHPVEEPELWELEQDAARDFWAPGGEHHSALVAAMKLADVVTVPDHPLTIGDAMRHNPATWVLPDLNDTSEAGMNAFVARLLKIMAGPVTRKRREYRSAPSW